MKRNYTLLMFLLSFCLFAQVNNKDNNKSNQKHLKLSNVSDVNQALNQFSKMYNLEKGYSFKEGVTSTDKLSNTHIRHQQIYKGIEVFGGSAITHTRNGQVYYVNGELYNVNDLSIEPSFSKSVGFDRTITKIGATKYLWEDEESARNTNYTKPEGELVVYPSNSNNHKLAYRYDIYSIEPLARDIVYIDANSGEILYKEAIIKHAHDDRLKYSPKNDKCNEELESSIVLGSAATRYSGTQSIETTFTGGNYVLQDVTRGNGVNTYNSGRRTVYPLDDFTDNDNNWTEHNNANMDNAALDAHWGAEMTYDYWDVYWGRNSYDGAGAAINSWVHYDRNYDNAFWNGVQMTYGDGNTFDALTALDVCAHEIGHAICTYTANLTYQGESGALNEGFSDLWGAVVEHIARTGSTNGPYANAIWDIGEDIGPGGTPLRTMANPKLSGDPDTVGGGNWKNTCNGCADSGGVHSNSGILNYWFYLLVTGNNTLSPNDNGDAYNVPQIGMDKAMQIAFLAERDYLTAGSQFADARDATITAASVLFCSASAEVQAVTEAWYAVGVGAQYTGLANDVALLNVAANLDVSCAGAFVPTIEFENGGTNPITSVSISYNVDGGAPIANSWTGNLLTCQSQVFNLTSFPALTRGAHILDVTTTIVSDGNATNNTQSSIIIINDAGLVNDTNDFEAGGDLLVSYDQGATTSMWEKGVPVDTLLGSAASGTQVYATVRNGNHPDATTGYLVSQCYDLTTLTGPYVEFNMAFDIENDWDHMWFEYSTDGTSWNVLGSQADPAWFNSNSTANGLPGAQWSGEGESANPLGGTNATWHLYSHDLTFLNAETSVLFRFVFLADAGVNEEGAIVDDFAVKGTIACAAVDSTEEINAGSGYVAGTNVTICEGNTGGIQPTVPSGANPTYSWSGPNTFTQNTRTVDLSTLTAADSGAYTVSVDMDGSCTFTDYIFNVTINPTNPDLTTSVEGQVNGGGYASGTSVSSIEGDQVELRLPSSAFNGTWQWYNPQGTSMGTGETQLVGAAVVDADPTQEGTWQVTATFTNDCARMVPQTINFDVIINALATDFNEFNGLAIYPNPTNGLLNISSSSNLINSTISIIDLRGRIISKDINSQLENNITVDLSNLAQGSYFISIENDSNKSVRQIIKN